MNKRKVPGDMIFRRHQPFPSPAMRAKILDFWAQQPRKEKEPRKVSTALSFHSAFISAYGKATDAESSESVNGLVNDVCIVCMVCVVCRIV